MKILDNRISYWEKVIEEIKETGNYKTGHAKVIEFFYSKSYPTKESKIEYCNLIIKLIKIEKMNYNNEVAEFMLGAIQEIPNQPKIDNLKINELRVNLIKEELNELEQALNDDNKVEVLDALVDLQYVLSGAINQLGFSKIFNLAFQEVHTNNMTKFHKTEDEALKTVSHHVQDGTPCHAKYNLEIDMWGVFRNTDKKLLKPKNYTPVNLKEFIK